MATTRRKRREDGDDGRVRCDVCGAKKAPDDACKVCVKLAEKAEARERSPATWLSRGPQGDLLKGVLDFVIAVALTIGWLWALDWFASGQHGGSPRIEAKKTAAVFLAPFGILFFLGRGLLRVVRGGWTGTRQIAKAADDAVGKG